MSSIVPVGRLSNIQHAPTDYRLFLDILREAKEMTDIAILSFALMPNHWHLELWPNMMVIWVSSCIGLPMLTLVGINRASPQLISETCVVILSGQMGQAQII